ncbi:MAG TPA: NAD(P)H-hydrate epimerase [Candidatus Omnitrophota bacterium]|nr:NAD(P)H-hydrate epimerase [Candidatus Omnitrophota bacterium]HPD84467.1 NAD(P)H-hydrate epimerase [Candidatus Omnitrophota bacterium]HRZ03325.1 NAD(P)H-hydrate epimerase [Candidatus Omnitrophota bacterium]
MITYKALSARQVQRLDKIAIEEIGIPSVALMENAGRAVSGQILARLKKSSKKFVSVFCGTGNNAGDGFVIARYLLNAGLTPKVFIVGRARYLKSDAEINYRTLKKLKCPVREIRRVDQLLLRDIAKSKIIVDALFGVGLNRPVGELFKNVIEAVNAARKYIIAVDVPSGLDATTGKTFGACIQADLTVTLSCVKKGFLKNAGPRHTGRIVVADIGIPLKLLGKVKAI